MAVMGAKLLHFASILQL